MRLACLLLGCLPALGQTPATPVTKAPGDTVTLDVSVNSQPSKPPVAVQWELVVPAQVLQMQGDPEIGSAARDAGKSLQCTARKPYLYTCVLSGGPKPIATGPIATFHFLIRAVAQKGPTILRTQNAQATTADSKQESLNDTESTVVIR